MWFEDESNGRLLDRLREALRDGGRVLVFLGAGLSFGSRRSFGRAAFDYERYDRYPPWEYHGGPFPPLAPDDDGQPLPSWPWLINRMWHELTAMAPSHEHTSLYRFFREEGPLDCAQLFRQSVGEANYAAFLRSQFDVGREPGGLTPSHRALVDLDLRVLFTTNYDELIEAAYVEAAKSLRVSVSEEEFIAHRGSRPERHLIKLHGSIDQLDSVVLTRRDYARARGERHEMFGHLRHELSDASFLFVGFSLSDPNFGL